MKKPISEEGIRLLKAKRIAAIIAEQNGISEQEALELFLKSKTYELMKNPETGYAYDGDVALYEDFQDRYDDEHETEMPQLDENTKNKDVLEWMKAVYTKAMSGELQWKPIHPNNMPCNGVEGTYSDMFFKRGDKLQYLKFSIEYMSRCDENGLSHPEEGVRYYVLHSLEIDDLDAPFEIPEPSDNYPVLEESLADMVNQYGRFRYVFDDEETAKKVALNELIQMIYPHTYILTYPEYRHWKWFVKHFEHQK